MKAILLKSTYQATHFWLDIVGNLIKKMRECIRWIQTLLIWEGFHTENDKGLTNLRVI